MSTYTDTTVVANSYYYVVSALDVNGNESCYSNEITLTLTGIKDENQILPGSFELSQNYPNPFNPQTTIQYSLPQKCHVVVKVYNALGEEIAELVNSYEDAGYHKVDFDANRLSSGIYFYRIQAGEFSSLKKMILLR